MSSVLLHNDNLGFEQNDLDPWILYPDGTVFSVSDDHVYEGLQSLRISTPANDNVTTYDVSDYAAATAGITYEASVWYYLPEDLLPAGPGGDSGEMLALGIGFYDGGNNLLSGFSWEQAWWPIGAADDAVTDDWTQLFVTAEAPEDTEVIQITLQTWGRGSVFYFDEVSVVPEPGSFLLILIGGIGLYAWRGKRINARRRG